LTYSRRVIGFLARYKIKPRVHFKYQPRVDSIGNADSVRINIEYYDINEPIIVVQEITYSSWI